MEKKNDARTAAPETARKYGKFATAEELIAAYNALETESAEKSRYIKRLQERLGILSAQDEFAAVAEASDGEQAVAAAETSDGDRVSDDEPNAATFGQNAENDGADEAARQTAESRTDGARVQDAAFDGARVLDAVAQHAAEFAETLAALPEIMDACVARYKRKLIGGGSACAPPAGMAIIAPVKRPRSLYEAKLIADELIGASGNR